MRYCEKEEGKKYRWFILFFVSFLFFSLLVESESTENAEEKEEQ